MNYKIKGLEVEITDEQLDELIKERENKGKPWKPEHKEHYYYADSFGDGARSCWAGSRFDLRMYNTNNCFKTREEARKRAKYDNAVIAVNVKIRELNDGWTPDWDNGADYKCYFYFCGGSVGITNTSTWRVPGVLMYFRSERIGELILEECAEELDIIRKYKFNK